MNGIINTSNIFIHMRLKNSQCGLVRTIQMTDLLAAWNEDNQTSRVDCDMVNPV